MERGSKLERGFTSKRTIRYEQLLGLRPEAAQDTDPEPDTTPEPHIRRTFTGERDRRMEPMARANDRTLETKSTGWANAAKQLKDQVEAAEKELQDIEKQNADLTLLVQERNKSAGERQDQTRTTMTEVKAIRARIRSFNESGEMVILHHMSQKVNPAIKSFEQMHEKIAYPAFRDAIEQSKNRLIDAWQGVRRGSDFASMVRLMTDVLDKLCVQVEDKRLEYLSHVPDEVGLDG